MSAGVALAVNRIGKRFGAATVLQDVSFHVDRGEMLALLGASGSGKTTILRIIAGFETPDSGAIVIGGKPSGNSPPYERNVGLVFQDYALFPHMTVAGNIAYGMRHRGVPRQEIPDRVASLLRLVKLQGFDQRHPAQLSGGQQQRVALARALGTMPPLLLLDEPLSALDAKLRQELRLELKEILASAGCAVVIVTHDQEEAMSLGDRIVIMDHGRVVQSGPPHALYDRPVNRMVADFLGRTNWFPNCTIGRAGADGMLCCQLPHGQRIHAVDGGQAGGSFDIGVRPERMEIWDDSIPASANGVWNRFSGRLIDRAHLGASVQLVVELESGQRVILLHANKGDAGHIPGEAVSVAFRAQDCILLPAAGS